MAKIFITELFKKISNTQKVALNQETTKEGITYVQSMILLFLDETIKQHDKDFEISQRDVERTLSLRSSTVTEILNRMETGGFLKREKSRIDSRSNRLLLTGKANNFIPRFFNILGDVEDQMTEGMDQTDRQKLKELLLKVSDNLEKMKL